MDEKVLCYVISFTDFCIFSIGKKILALIRPTMVGLSDMAYRVIYTGISDTIEWVPHLNINTLWIILLHSSSRTKF